MNGVEDELGVGWVVELGIGGDELGGDEWVLVEAISEDSRVGLLGEWKRELEKVRRWVEASGTGVTSEGFEGERLACSGEAHCGLSNFMRLKCRMRPYLG